MGYRKDKKNKFELVKTIDVNGYNTIILTLPESKFDDRECSLTQEKQYRMVDSIKNTYPNFKVIVLPPTTKMVFIKEK